MTPGDRELSTRDANRILDEVLVTAVEDYRELWLAGLVRDGKRVGSLTSPAFKVPAPTPKYPHQTKFFGVNGYRSDGEIDDLCRFLMGDGLPYCLGLRKSRIDVEAIRSQLDHPPSTTHYYGVQGSRRSETSIHPRRPRLERGAARAPRYMPATADWWTDPYQPVVAAQIHEGVAG